MARFKNPYISDAITRVARTPIRKLGYDERFIRPIRELHDRNLSYQQLLTVVGLIFNYRDEKDEQSVELQKMLQNESLEAVVRKVTQLTDETLIAEIVAAASK